MQSLKEKAAELSATMRCNCDLDNWQPEASTGHSCVCRIHRAALGLSEMRDRRSAKERAYDAYVTTPRFARDDY